MPLYHNMFVCTPSVSATSQIVLLAEAGIWEGILETKAGEIGLKGRQYDSSGRSSGYASFNGSFSPEGARLLDAEITIALTGLHALFRTRYPGLRPGLS